MRDGDERPADTSRPVVDAGSDVGRSTLRGRRILYGVTSAALTVIMGLAVADGLGAVDAYGVDTRWVRAAGGGFELEVRYTTVTRPALASPFEIVVRRPGGFDGAVTIAVSRKYLAMWDENGFYPTPSSETSMGDWLVWEFDPPKGDVFSFAYDARLEPGAQNGRSGEVAILDDEHVVVTGVELRTRVRP